MHVFFIICNGPFLTCLTSYVVHKVSLSEQKILRHVSSAFFLWTSLFIYLLFVRVSCKKDGCVRHPLASPAGYSLSPAACVACPLLSVCIVSVARVNTNQTISSYMLLLLSMFNLIYIDPDLELLNCKCTQCGILNTHIELLLHNSPKRTGCIFLSAGSASVFYILIRFSSLPRLTNSKLLSGRGDISRIFK